MTAPLPAGAAQLPGVPFGLALLALAVLLAGGPRATRRLSELTAPGPTRGAAPPAVLGRGWIAVGAAAVAASTWAVAGPGVAAIAGGLTALAGTWIARRAATAPRDAGAADRAAAWELLAVCLGAGMPVAAAVPAATGGLAGATGSRLRRVAGLLELGADPGDAWAVAEDLPTLAAFARAARRSAGTGSALAQVARAEGERLRAGLLDTAQARAQRAAVHITGPLGLCFLPAFLALGIAPVVIGLAGRALAQW
jgi:hypothetical protein